MSRLVRSSRPLISVGTVKSVGRVKSVGIVRSVGTAVGRSLSRPLSSVSTLAATAAAEFGCADPVTEEPQAATARMVAAARAKAAVTVERVLIFTPAGGSADGQVDRIRQESARTHSDTPRRSGWATPNGRASPSPSLPQLRGLIPPFRRTAHPGTLLVSGSGALDSMT